MPVEVVGLGGLLTVPEVADLRATLQVLDDPTADAAAAATAHRRRAGGSARATWRRSAVAPASSCAAAAPAAGRPGRGGGARRRRRRRSARSSTLSTTCRPAADPLSAEGRRRLEALRDELRALRRRVDQPLPDLVARRRAHPRCSTSRCPPARTDPAAARADLDAFADAAAQFAGDTAQDGAGEAVLSAFLAHLVAAEDEEHGLDTGAVERRRHREADDRPRREGAGVAGRRGAGHGPQHVGRRLRLPGQAGDEHLVDGQRPAAAVPPARRPGRAARPGRAGAGGPRGPPRGQRRARRPRGAAAGVRRRHPGRARRCCARATTGARAATVVGPSVFLQEAREACLDGAGEVGLWVEDPPLENPVVGTGRTAAWPAPDAPAAPGVQAAAARVRELLDGAPGLDLSLDLSLDDDAAAVVARWDDDLRRLAEEASRRRTRRTDGSPAAGAVGHRAGRAAPRPGGAGEGVAAPAAPPSVAGHPAGHGLPRLAGDDRVRPAAAARPRRAARRGRRRRRRRRRPRRRCRRRSAPARGGGGRRARSRCRSRWRSTACWSAAGWTPSSPRTTAVTTSSTGRPAVRPAGQTPRRRRCSSPPTGWPGTSSAARRWSSVRAAFFYVRSGETVRPADLLDAEGLRALVAGVELAEG